MFAPYPSNRNAHDFQTVVANPDILTFVVAQNYGRTYDLAGSGEINLSNSPGPTILRGMNIHGSLTVNKYFGSPLPTYPRTLRYMLCGGGVTSDGLAAHALDTNYAFEGDVVAFNNENPANLFTVSGTSRFGFNWFPFAADSPSRPTMLVIDGGVSATGYRPLHSGGTSIYTNGIFRWFHMPVDPLTGTVTNAPVSDVSGGGKLILASDFGEGYTTALSNVTVAYITVESGTVVISDGQSFPVQEVLVDGMLRMEGASLVASSVDVAGVLDCANSSGADAAILGDLVFSGGSSRVRFAQSGESSGSSWLPTTIGAVAIGGDLNTGTISRVFLNRMAPGAYTIFTHAGTRTGTLPDPILSGGGATPGFSTYNYNANSVEVVFV